MTIRVNVDGHIGTETDRLLSPLDHGFLFGASVYETIRTYDGVPFLLGRHLTRLRASAEALAIHIDVSDADLTDRVHQTLDAAGNPESTIRLIVTPGAGEIDYRQGSARHPSIVVIVRPLGKYPESLYTEGAKAAFVETMRAGQGSDPRVKSSNLLNNIRALRQAHEKGAYEGLLLNPAGEVCEGSMSNVFIVVDGKVRTPPVSAGLLEGITRELVLTVAEDAGLQPEEATILPEELLAADEVFVTATSRQIVPIVQVDNTTIGPGKPGPVTTKLISHYQQKVEALMRSDAQPSERK